MADRRQKWSRLRPNLTEYGANCTKYNVFVILSKSGKTNDLQNHLSMRHCVNNGVMCLALLVREICAGLFSKQELLYQLNQILKICKNNANMLLDHRPNGPQTSFVAQYIYFHFFLLQNNNWLKTKQITSHNTVICLYHSSKNGSPGHHSVKYGSTLLWTIRNCRKSLHCV